MNGWISIDRDIKYRWVFKYDQYFITWETILLDVNHHDNKVLIDSEIIDCKRGQSLNSLQTWCNIFGKNWSIQKVRTFFKLLENDSMIQLEGLRKTTRLTVCKYDSYQVDQHTNNTQTTSKQHTNNTQVTTNNKVNKDNKDIYIRKQQFADSIKPYLEVYGKEMLNGFYLYWTEHGDNDKKMRYEKEKTFGIKQRLERWSNNNFNQTKNEEVSDHYANHVLKQLNLNK